MALSKFQKIILFFAISIALFILLVGEKDIVTCYQKEQVVESIENGQGAPIFPS